MNVPPRVIRKPLVSTNMHELVDPFDANFVDVDQVGLRFLFGNGR